MKLRVASESAESVTNMFDSVARSRDSCEAVTTGGRKKAGHKNRTKAPTKCPKPNPKTPPRAKPEALKRSKPRPTISKEAKP